MHFSQPQDSILLQLERPTSPALAISSQLGIGDLLRRTNSPKCEAESGSDRVFWRPIFVFLLLFACGTSRSVGKKESIHLTYAPFLKTLIKIQDIFFFLHHHRHFALLQKTVERVRGVEGEEENFFQIYLPDIPFPSPNRSGGRRNFPSFPNKFSFLSSAHP